ncbi:MAG TPA: redoxin domain-containing protein [Solirubrobacteraceae bacterium]|jgi:thiol-disulfide isomerase/thioredoxin|nr:redoxin domain-containing protein [Solirubrobacteraceae bacterium]
MKPPIDTIAAPQFPPRLPWINVAPLRMEQQVGRPVLVEFWDFCRPNSIRTQPYLRAWHERYEAAGLRVIGVHSSGFPPSGDPEAVRAAVRRLEVPYPVAVDTELAIWREYGNLGWPARYLFNQQGRLFDYHYGEGAYDETERLIQGLLDVEGPILAPVRPEDAPGAVLAPQSDDVAGPYSGPYEAGGVWAVLEGEGTATANRTPVTVDHPGCYQLISHPRSTAGELDLRLSAGVECHAVCFTPGLAAQRPLRDGKRGQ